MAGPGRALSSLIKPSGHLSLASGALDMQAAGADAHGSMLRRREHGMVGDPTET
jgi:hypothetical protein